MKKMLKNIALGDWLVGARVLPGRSSDCATKANGSALEACSMRDLEVIYQHVRNQGESE